MPAKQHPKKRTTKVPPSVKSYVKRQMRTNTELKRCELQDQESLQGIPASGVPFFRHDVLACAEGTGPNDRIGNEVRLQGIQVKGMFNNNVNITIYCRVLIGYFTGSQDTYSAVNEFTPLFKDAQGVAFSASSIVAVGTKNYALMTTPTHPTYWTSLYDKVIKIGPSASTDGNNTRLFNKFIKLHNKKVEFVLSGTINPIPRLQVIRLYTDAPQDASTAQTMEYSGLTQVWYRDA